MEEEETEEKAESEVVAKIEGEGAEVATELDEKEGEKLEELEPDKKLEETETDEKLEAQVEETQLDDKKVEKIEEEETASKNSEKAETAAPEETKSNVDDLKELGTTGEESNPEDKMEVEQVDEKVEVESEKSKTEENASEGESEKENVSEEVVKSVEGAAEESGKDDSFSSAACAVIGSTNALISSLRQEMAARNSLVAPKQIPRQKPKSGKFWKEERSAFR